MCVWDGKKLPLRSGRSWPELTSPFSSCGNTACVSALELEMKSQIKNQTCASVTPSEVDVILQKPIETP